MSWSKRVKHPSKVLNVGDTVEFFFSEHRALVAAKRFIRKALKRHGRPERIVIDGSQTNREAIIACDGSAGCGIVPAGR